MACKFRRLDQPLVTDAGCWMRFGNGSPGRWTGCIPIVIFDALRVKTWTPIAAMVRTNTSTWAPWRPQHGVREGSRVFGSLQRGRKFWPQRDGTEL